ncbi:MAG TPA: FGGY-family carbohydrate kinase [Pirellulaceae bacterium]|nr:FGGY-family carbohydrate kinase [Pirellulaceae bacterium]
MADAVKVYLAADLGASGGRVVAGIFDGQQLSLEEVYRFDNGGVAAAGRLQWDLLSQWSHVQRGLRAAGKIYPGQVKSVGVDTWGVDFGLIGRNDELLGNPYHYRDRRTAGIFEKAFAIVPREEIFAHTGLQFMEFNTLYQLLAMKLARSPLLDVAERLLLIPDLYHWLLTGQKANEFTDASTTQFYNPKTKTWASELLTKFGLPTNILGEIAQPGTRLGKLLPAVADETGLAGVEVVLPGTHDTASAVMAVPAASTPGAKPNWCYISSGTWSLMGVETPEPVISDRCYQLNFTNEGGVGGTVRLLKNIGGLWLVQECRRIWKADGHEYGWDELTRRASQSPPLVSLIDPDDPSFTAPKDMPAAIRDYCRRTNQPAPDSEGAVIRCALESLALRYRMVLGMLEELIGGRLETIHIVGGGTQNRLLNQMAADATSRRVVAGPVEATAIGNLMMQAVADGAVGDIAQAREIISRSFAVQQFLPKNPRPWDAAYETFQRLLEKT